MPLYMDIHRNVHDITPQKIEEAHQRDLAAQGKHGVTYHKYWYDAEEGHVFCLVEAPSKEAAAAVHREATGMEADEIHEVTEGR